MKKRMIVNISIFCLTMIFSFSLIARASEIEKKKIVGDPYTLDKCIITGEKLGSMGYQVILNYEGREVRFCCQGCVAAFKNDPDKSLKKIDEAIIKDQLPYYPLEKCIVSGGKLGAMGEPINYVYNNRLVRFCCAGCVPKFEKDPQKYADQINAAVIKQQSEKYPLTTCVVSGGKLGGMGEPVNVVIANRLVKLCCKGCEAKVMKNPLEYLAKLKKK